MSGIKRADVARIVALYESWQHGWSCIVKVSSSPHNSWRFLSQLSFHPFSSIFCPFSSIFVHFPRGFSRRACWSCWLCLRCKAYGGVYADIDVEAARCFDPLLQAAQNARMGVLLGEAHRHRAIGIGGQGRCCTCWTFRTWRMNANDTKDPPKLLHELSFCWSLMIFDDLCGLVSSFFSS